MYLLVDVLFEDGLGVDEVGLKILLKHFDTFRIGQSLEGDGACLDVGRDVGEVEITTALIKFNCSDIFDDGKLVIVDSDCQRHWLFDLRSLQ